MKIKQKVHLFIAVVFIGIAVSGCASTSHKAFRTDESQVELRNIQTRAFDITDRKLMMQNIVSTMQDLDFVIDKADVTLGTITGTKFSRSAYITMSVTVRPRGETQLMVRANAQYGTVVVKDAETYQDFFNSLGKSLFLTAHQVD